MSASRTRRSKKLERRRTGSNNDYLRGVPFFFFAAPRTRACFFVRATLLSECGGAVCAGDVHSPAAGAGATGGRFSLRFGAGEAGLGTCFLCAVGAAGIEDSSAGGVYLHGIAAAGKDTSGGEVGQISGDGGVLAAVALWPEASLA